jgi:hypothetical protein
MATKKPARKRPAPAPRPEPEPETTRCGCCGDLLVYNGRDWECTACGGCCGDDIGPTQLP